MSDRLTPEDATSIMFAEGMLNVLIEQKQQARDATFSKPKKMAGSGPKPH